MSTFGGIDEPCVGFGFGDAVIFELLKDKNLLPQLQHQVDDIVYTFNNSLKNFANGVSQKLRKCGRTVDFILESDRKIKWVIKHAEKCNAKRLILIGGEEWVRGNVCVKDLAKREQIEVPTSELFSFCN